MKLDTEEKEILRSVESGEWRSIGVTERERTRYGQYAEATFRKDRRVNIRISRKDLEAIQKRALTEGLPYQTLISSLLHKYAAGRVIEASVADAGVNRTESADIDEPRTVDQKLRFAIAHRRLIEVAYGGTVRIAEPYDYGIRRDTATLMMYQLSIAGVPKSKSTRGWKLLDVSKIEELTVLPDNFSGDRDKSSSELVLVNEVFSPNTNEPASHSRIRR